MPKVLVELAHPCVGQVPFEDAEFKVLPDDTLQIQQEGELVAWFPKGSYHHFTVKR